MIRYAEPRRRLISEQMTLWNRERTGRMFDDRKSLFDDLRAGRDRGDVLHAVENIHQDPDVLDAIDHAYSNGEDLVMLGPPGTGKSFIQLALLRECVFTGRSVAIISAIDIADADIDDLIAPQVLLIEDVGVQATSEVRAEKWFAIFDRRYDQSKTTVTSSNLDAAAFDEHLGARIVDRIDGPTIVLAGPSRRRHPVPEPAVPEGFDTDAPYHLRDAVAALDGDAWRLWAQRMAAAGFYELIARHNDGWVEHSPARYIEIVRETWGDEHDSILFPNGPAAAG